MAEMQLGPAEKAKKIIMENNYMVIASHGRTSGPWASPVFYAYDKKYSFYFLSAVDAIHIENITENPRIGAVIFDSKQKIGKTEAVQFHAVATMVKKDGIHNAIETYSERLFPASKLSAKERYNPSEYLEPSEFRFVKVVPTLMYVNGPDRHIEVNFEEMQD